MKKAMKKLMAALLAVAMVCAMAIPAFAAEGGVHNSSSEDGKIIIKNAVAGKTYKIYRILDLQYNATTKSYRYVKNTKWGSFVDSATSYLTLNASTGDVTWVKNADVQDFAKEAGLQASSINAEAEKKAQGEDKGTIEFSGLPLGWYLVVSDLNNGSICSIDSTATEVIIEEKNSLPTVTKLVKEGNTYGYYNDANIGDVVEFNTRITVNDGKPTNYVLHDTMGSGFEFDKSSVTVYRWRYGHEETLENGTHYDLITDGLTDNCTFEIKFKDTALAPSDLFSVTYKATVKASAVIGSTGNPNTTHLTYNGEDTPDSTTKTYVWEMDVHKFAKLSTTEPDHALANAEFQLYKTNADTSVSYAVLTETNTGNATDATEYKFAKWGTQTEATTVVTPASGNIKLIGLDAGTYYLEETKAPTGYNTLTAPITVVIDLGTLPTVAGSTVSCTVKYDGTEATDNKTVRVENKSGTVLPSTGGIGTTIFYVVGGGLMVAAAILLITKKRMENR